MRKEIKFLVIVLLVVAIITCALIKFFEKKTESINVNLPAVVCDDYGQYIGQSNLLVKGTWNEREQRFTGYVSSDYVPYSCADAVMEQDFVIREEASGVVYSTSMLFETPTAYKGEYIFTASVDFTQFAVYFNGYGFEGLIVAPAEKMEDVNDIMENWIFKFG